MKKSFDVGGVSKFFSETAMGQRVKRSGFTLTGASESQSLGEHIYRAAQIGYVLAFLEGVDPEKTVAIILFHDNGEFRIGDQHKVSARYVNKHDSEREAMVEQLDRLPEDLRNHLLEMYDDFDKRGTSEAVVAQDADWLENAISAKELLEQGYKGAQNWIDNVAAALETDSAKRVLDYIQKEDDFTNSWWQGLKKMTYTKLGK
jgi:putative hydrolase of HD superfamily